MRGRVDGPCPPSDRKRTGDRRHFGRGLFVSCYAFSFRRYSSTL